MSAITPMQRSLLIEAHRNERLVIRPSVHNRRNCAEALSRRQLLKPVGWLLSDGRQVKQHQPTAIAQVYKLTHKGKVSINETPSPTHHRCTHVCAARLRDEQIR